MQSLPDLIRLRSTPLEPQPTAATPRLPVLEGIRCVAFDVYGTLFVSGSGDIGITDAAQKESVLRTILADFGLPPLPRDRSIVTHFHDLIVASHAASRREGILYPEVEVRELWADLLTEFHPEVAPSAEEIDALAVAYELATNPVWPMPGATDILSTLRESSLPLGIVSNAQFYTPLLFEAFFEQTPEQLGFDPDLSFFSHTYRRGKPGTWLYEQLRDALAAIGIAASETLYIGNDALKDVHAATTVGFRTALFAGDQRSLRLHADRNDLLPPDAILTDLRQVSDLFG